jgi:hypothetical protein
MSRHAVALLASLLAASALAAPGPESPEPVAAPEPVVITGANGYTTVFDHKGRWSEVISPVGETLYLQYDGPAMWPARYSVDGMNWKAIAYAPNGDEEQKFRDFASAMSTARASRSDGRTHAQWTEIEPIPDLPPPPILPELDVYVPVLGGLDTYNRTTSDFDYLNPSTWDSPMCKSQCEQVYQWSLVGCGFIAFIPGPSSKLTAFLCAAGERAVRDYCTYTAINC